MQQLLGDPGTWKQWASTLARFPTYSPGNALLIMAQRPDATYVAGYHAWQKLGRQVQKGERGISILAPVTYRVPAEEASPSDATAAVRQVVAFKAVTVFALEQTQGAPLQLPRATPLQGDTMGQLLSHLMGVPGVPVRFGDTGPAYGVWNPATQEITLRQDAAADQHLKTLLHEWSHSLGMATLEQARHRHVGLEEVTAETTAYVMAQAMGLNTHGYSQGYVAGWADGDPKKVAGVVQEVGRRVHHMVTQIEQAAQHNAALMPVAARFHGPQGDSATERVTAARKARTDELAI